MHLSHIRSVGEFFTWHSNRPGHPIHRKLDYLLGNPTWISTFTDTQVFVHHREILDYNPLILNVPFFLEKYKKPFQFFGFMTELEGFMKLLEKCGILHCMDPMSILFRTLQVHIFGHFG